jgi:hypothetical protein
MRARDGKVPEEYQDILCIGEIRAGKSYFLSQFTHDESPEKLHSAYDIYSRKVNGRFVYFHELSEEEPVYLEQGYNGVLFFVDLVNSWNAVSTILQWVELISRLTGTNIFKIPVRVIVTQTGREGRNRKWRESL